MKGITKMKNNNKSTDRFQVRTDRVPSGLEESKAENNIDITADRSQRLPPIEEYLLVTQRVIDKNELAPKKLQKLKEVMSRYEPCREHASTSCDISACRLSRLPEHSPSSIEKRTDVGDKNERGFDKVHQNEEENSDTMPLDDAIRRIRDKINADFEDFEKRYRNRVAIDDLSE